MRDMNEILAEVMVGGMFAIELLFIMALGLLISKAFKLICEL